MGKKKKGKKGKQYGYDPTNDMFEGTAEASMPGNGRYFNDGVYLTRSEVFKRGMSSEASKGPYTVLEATILQVLVEYENSNKVGERVAWIVRNAWGEAAHSARKGYVAAVLDLDPKRVTAQVLQDLTDPKDNTVQGIQLITTAVSVPTKAKNGRPPGVFTKVTWQGIEDYEPPEEQKKKKKKKKKKKA